MAKAHAAGLSILRRRTLSDNGHCAITKDELALRALFRHAGQASLRRLILLFSLNLSGITMPNMNP
jgi:hypothetical protein